MVAQGITSTGGADFIITKVLGTPKDTMLAQASDVILVMSLGGESTRGGGMAAPWWHGSARASPELRGKGESSVCRCSAGANVHHSDLLQVRMCLVTAVFSSFVNDTPVFCIMMPIVSRQLVNARARFSGLSLPVLI